jgi:hypothetical protein
MVGLLPRPLGVRKKVILMFVLWGIGLRRRMFGLRRWLIDYTFELRYGVFFMMMEARGMKEGESKGLLQCGRRTFVFSSVVTPCDFWWMILYFCV